MKKDIQATSTNTTDKKAKSSKRRNLLTAALALALGAAIFAPLASAPASASLDSGVFCIRASSGEAGEFKGVRGNCGTKDPEVPAPVEPEVPGYVPVAFHRLSVTVPNGSPLANETVSVIVRDAATREILSEKSATANSPSGYLYFGFGFNLEKADGYRSLIVEASFKGESRTHTLLVSDGSAYTAANGNDVLSFGNVYLTGSGTVYYVSGPSQPTW